MLIIDSRVFFGVTITLFALALVANVIAGASLPLFGDLASDLLSNLGWPPDPRMMANLGWPPDPRMVV
ncbi:MAG: hypothetical protein FJW37_02415 [Acidobacteria bacterium]|nr:hypothetical protein [Acidobacteriota bacterium]